MAPTRFRVWWIALAVLAAQPAFAVYYSLLGGGAQLDIGDAQMPLQPDLTTMGSPFSGTMFPPLLIPPKGVSLIVQTAGPDPKRMIIPPGVLFRKAPPAPAVLGVALRNPVVYQVRTNVEFSGPALPAIFGSGGRTGAATATFAGPGSTSIRYTATAAQFGGPASIRVLPATPLRRWGHGPAPGAQPPCQHPAFGGVDADCVAIIATAHPGVLAAPGAKAGFMTVTPGGPPAMSPGIVAVSVPRPTGLVAKSVTAAKTAPVTSMATSYGFPWTTGMVTISAPSAAGGAELFTLTGMDSRVNGVGTISLVSGALSTRTYMGTNANRGWLQLTLPEPGAALGVAAALATLALVHALVRRRAKLIAEK